MAGCRRPSLVIGSGLQRSLGYRPSANSVGDQADHEQDQEHYKEYLGDDCRARRNASKAEDCCDECQNQKGECPRQHDRSPLLNSFFSECSYRGSSSPPIDPSEVLLVKPHATAACIVGQWTPELCKLYANRCGPRHGLLTCRPNNRSRHSRASGHTLECCN